MCLLGVGQPWGFSSVLISGGSREEVQSETPFLASVFKYAALSWSTAATAGTLLASFTAYLLGGVRGFILDRRAQWLIPTNHMMKKNLFFGEIERVGL